MRLSELKFQDVELNKFFKAIQGVLSNISKDNLVTVTINDTTDSTPDTSKKFRHGLGRVPSIYFVTEGNAYVAFNSVTEQEVDVRSSNSEEPFKLLLVR